MARQLPSTPLIISTLLARAKAKAKAAANPLKSNSVTIVTGGDIGLRGALVARGPREVEVHRARFARAKGMGHLSVQARPVEHLSLLFLGQAGERGTKAAKERAARMRDSLDGARARAGRGYQHLMTRVGISMVETQVGAAHRAHGPARLQSHHHQPLG